MQNAAERGPALTVEHVSKRFRKPLEARHTLKERVLHPLSGRQQTGFDALKDVSFDVREASSSASSGATAAARARC